MVSLAAAVLGGVAQLRAQAGPEITRVDPVSGATGVSETANLVITFNAVMNDSATTFVLTDHATGKVLPVTWDWCYGNTLICTPSPAWPAPNKRVDWSVNAFDADLNPLVGDDSGTFTTGAGTYAITTLTASRIDHYNQTNTAPPLLDQSLSFGFAASATLASNRPATNILFTLPTSASTNLTKNPINCADFYLLDGGTNQGTFDEQYPGGGYLFNIQSSTSNQQITLGVPAISAQPPAPHVSNFAAAQSLDSTQPFTLTWDIFSGGTASDFIVLEISTNFTTPGPGAAGVLPGTATSVQIPANTLLPSSSVSSCYLTFYHGLVISNASYTSIAYRATSTRFSLTTTNSIAAGPLVLTGGTLAENGFFSFTVIAPPGQTVSVLYSDTLEPGSWNIRTTTNTPAGGRFQFIDTSASHATQRAYRARKGT